MNLKKIVSVSLCSAMVLSLVGCSLNPKTFFSNLINGNGGGGGNDVVLSDKVNKDAVFKELTSFTVSDKFEYIEQINCVNGRLYVGTVTYDYPEGMFDGYDLYEEEVNVPEEDGDDEEADTENKDNEEDKENASENKDADAKDAEDAETAPETADAEDAEDVDDSEDWTDDIDFYEDYVPDMSGAKGTLLIANFTGAADIQVLEVEWDPSEYLTSKVNVDADGNYYLCFDSYNYQTYEETYKLKKLSPTGELLKEMTLSGNSSDYFYVNGICTDSQGNTFVVTEGQIQIFDKDFNATGTYKLDKDAYVSNMFINSKDEFVILLEKYAESGYEASVQVVDAKGNGKEEAGTADLLGGKSLVEGKGYDYYYQTSGSVYGFNVGDKKATEVVNFYDSDIDPDSISTNIVFIDSEHFVVPAEEGAGMIVYEKVPADQVVDKEVLTLGTVYGSYAVSKQIIDFNKNNSTYRIKLIDYSEFSTPDDWMGGSKRFNTDLTSGSAPDIIVPEAYDVANLIDKGVFTDLTPLMANSNGIKKEDLVANAQTLFAKDDKLYCIYPSFTVEGVMIKDKFYKENMTIDDIIAWEQQTGKKAFEQSTKSGVLNTFMSLGMDAFLDPQTGKCSFDSDEFIKILEYANTYPAEYTEEDYDENYYKQYIYAFRNDNALISSAWVSNFRDYNWNKKYRFGEEKVVLAGVPIEGTKGASLDIEAPMGISSKCKHPEAAWEFIQTCFTPEYYEDSTWSMPSVESEFDKMVENAQKPETYIDENGNVAEIPDTIWLMDEEVELKRITPEEAAELKTFVTSISNIYTWDEELNEIIDEETQGFFQGQKSAKEVAGIIQSRLQIYINEKK